MEGLAQRDQLSRGTEGTFLRRPEVKFTAFFILLAVFTSAPIWGVQYFINQDGSGHVHSAWLMLELLRGDPQLAELYQFNLLTFPNVLGHWIQAVSLLALSPFNSTKLMLSLTYLGLIGSVVWLRWCTHGSDGLFISALLGAGVGYNWFWLQGAYNFNLGLIIAVAGTGAFYKWRNDLTWTRVAILGILLVLAFLGHVISFGIFCVAIAVILAFNFSSTHLIRTAVAFLGVAPLVFLYVSSTEAGGSFSPYWRSVQDPLSLSQWITQIRGVDSFVLIRRSAVPFIEAESSLYSILAPIVWIGLAIGSLLIGSIRTKEGTTPSLRVFLSLSVILIIVSFFVPDALRFSSSTGGLIRERLFIAGLLFVVPVFRPSGRIYSSIAAAALLLVIGFNTAVLWEYALRSDRVAREYFTATPYIPAGASIAGITIEPDTFRFSASPTSSINNYNGILRGAIVWDNYEFGHYLFPLISRKKSDQEFVLRYTQNNAYDLKTPGLMTDERIKALDESLSDRRIDTLLVWGTEPRIDAVVERHFGREPLYANGGVRLFRR